eukprot:2102598-Prymnesium_polylepis.1
MRARGGEGGERVRVRRRAYELRVRAAYEARAAAAARDVWSARRWRGMRPQAAASVLIGRRLF